MKFIKITREFAEKHYAEHIGKPFFEKLMKGITSGPIVAMVSTHHFHTTPDSINFRSLISTLSLSLVVWKGLGGKECHCLKSSDDGSNQSCQLCSRHCQRRFWHRSWTVLLLRKHSNGIIHPEKTHFSFNSSFLSD